MDKPKMSLRSLYTIFATHPEGQWIMESSNAQILYNFVKENKVKKILDLGTGIGASAAIMALALKDKGETDFQIDSIEQNKKCVRIANELIPEELRKHISIIHSNADTISFAEMPYQFFSIFSTLPVGEYDLIINDGPGPFLELGRYIDLPNGTIIAMLVSGALKPGTLIGFDGRMTSVAAIERYFSDNFIIVRKATGRMGDDLNIIERIDNPVACKDEKLEVMKNLTNYFKDENTISRNEPAAPRPAEVTTQGA